jgi:hypothetical protein
MASSQLPIALRLAGHGVSCEKILNNGWRSVEVGVWPLADVARLRKNVCFRG